MNTIHSLEEYRCEVYTTGGVLHYRLPQYLEKNARLLLQCRYIHLDAVLHIVLLDLEDLGAFKSIYSHRTAQDLSRGVPTKHYSKVTCVYLWIVEISFAIGSAGKYFCFVASTMYSS